MNRTKRELVRALQRLSTKKTDTPAQTRWEFWTVVSFASGVATISQPDGNGGTVQLTDIPYTTNANLVNGAQAVVAVHGTSWFIIACF